MFDYMVSVLVELHKNDNFRKQGENIYKVYTYTLFRDMKDKQVLFFVSIISALLSVRISENGVLSRDFLWLWPGHLSICLYIGLVWGAN